MVNKIITKKYTKYEFIVYFIMNDDERTAGFVAIGVLVSLFVVRIICCFCYCPNESYQVAPDSEEL